MTDENYKAKYTALTTPNIQMTKLFLAKTCLKITSCSENYFLDLYTIGNFC